MTRDTRIRSILTQQLDPCYLELHDDSASHAGHSGASAAGETHYTIIIEAECFSNLSKVMRHRMIYRLLSDEFQTGLHALAIEAFAVGERVALDA